MKKRGMNPHKINFFRYNYNEFEEAISTYTYNKKL